MLVAKELTIKGNILITPNLQQRSNFVSFLGTMFATLLLGATTAAYAVSFDCAKATGPTDKAVCASPQLSKLDSDLMDSYKSAISRGADHAVLRAVLNYWVRETRNKCNDEPCLIRVYQEKIAVLVGLNMAPQGSAAKAAVASEGKGVVAAANIQTIAGKGKYLHRIECKNTMVLRNIEPELCKDAQLRALMKKVDSYYETLDSKQPYHFETGMGNSIAMESRFRKEIEGDYSKYGGSMDRCTDYQCSWDLLIGKLGDLQDKIAKVEQEYGPTIAANKQRLAEDQEAIRISKADSEVVLRKWAAEREAARVADEKLKQIYAEQAKQIRDNPANWKRKAPSGSASTWSPPRGSLSSAGVGALAGCESLGAAVMMMGDDAAKGFDTEDAVSYVAARARLYKQFDGEYLMGQAIYMHQHSAYLAKAYKDGTLANVKNQVVNQCLGIP